MPAKTDLGPHWCFIAEIKSNASFYRETIELRDRDGRYVNMALRGRASSSVWINPKKLEPGKTVCILYAKQSGDSYDEEDLIVIEDDRLLQGQF
jgi:hypothetical protein